MEIRLTQSEATLLHSILARLAIRSRTGEMGFMHGDNRFVSMQLRLKKEDKTSLNNIAKKLSLSGGVLEIS